MLWIRRSSLTAGRMAVVILRRACSSRSSTLRRVSLRCLNGLRGGKNSKKRPISRPSTSSPGNGLDRTHEVSLGCLLKPRKTSGQHVLSETRNRSVSSNEAGSRQRGQRRNDAQIMPSDRLGQTRVSVEPMPDGRCIASRNEAGDLFDQVHDPQDFLDGEHPERRTSTNLQLLPALITHRTRSAARFRGSGRLGISTE